MTSPSFRVLLAGALFYAGRFLLQAIWVVEYPEGYNWGYPGVPSIFVPYGETADFFYSGHVGACVLLYLEAMREKHQLLSLLSLVTGSMQVFLMIALRSHYTVDMISAVVFAHYAFLMSESYLN